MTLFNSQLNEKNIERLNTFDIGIYEKEIEELNCIRSFKEWTKSISNRCKINIEGIQGIGDNAQFEIELETYIVNAMKLFPCWSSIMVSSFGYGDLIVSSSRVESNFNQLKNRLFKQQVMPIRVDSFMQEILPYYRGDNLLHQVMSQNMNDVHVTSQNPESVNVANNVHINEDSNYSIENNCITSAHYEEIHGIILNPNNEFITNNHPIQMNSSVHINQDFNTCSQSEQELYAVVHTSTILPQSHTSNKDDVYSNSLVLDEHSHKCLMCASGDLPTGYKKILTRAKAKNNTAQFILKMITQSSFKNIYKERALLLLNHFENNMQVLVGGLKQLDIIGTIKNIAEKLLEEFPSYRQINECTDYLCENFTSTETSSTVISLNAFDGQIDLEREILRFYSSTSEVCAAPKCGKNRNIEMIPISHLLIELVSVPLELNDQRINDQCWRSQDFKMGVAKPKRKTKSTIDNNSSREQKRPGLLPRFGDCSTVNNP
ncbi:hypothetical protein ACI65C_006583 [Semiaphis heraclei]